MGVFFHLHNLQPKREDKPFISSFIRSQKAVEGSEKNRHLLITSHNNPLEVFLHALFTCINFSGSNMYNNQLHLTCASFSTSIFEVNRFLLCKRPYEEHK